MKCPFLIGSKVYLRPLEPEDANVMVTWVNDPEVTRTLEMYRPLTLSNEREFIDRMAKSENDMALGIVTTAEDRFIGTAGLHRIQWKDRQAMFGIEIGVKSEWRLGYGTETTRLVVRHAFETLNLHRVWLHVYEDNPAGMRAYEKAGFRREGVLRESSYRDGRYRDTIAMGILRAEWRALEQPD